MTFAGPDSLIPYPAGKEPMRSSRCSPPTRWEHPRYTAGPAVSDYRFTGQREAADVGLYYFNARWYAPSIMQFNQPDSIIPDPYNVLDWDRYQYVRSNPIIFNDPTGHDVGCSAADPKCKKQNGYEDNKEWLNPFSYDTGKIALNLQLKLILGIEVYATAYYDQGAVRDNVQTFLGSYFGDHELSPDEFKPVEIYAGVDANLSLGLSEEVTGVLTYSGLDGYPSEQIGLDFILADGIPYEVSGCYGACLSLGGVIEITSDENSEITWGIGTGEGFDVSTDLVQASDYYFCGVLGSPGSWHLPVFNMDFWTH